MRKACWAYSRSAISWPWRLAARRLEGRLASGTAAAVGVAITGFGLDLLAAGELPLLYLGAALASVGQLIAASNVFAMASSIGGAGEQASAFCNRRGLYKHL